MLKSVLERVVEVIIGILLVVTVVLLAILVVVESNRKDTLALHDVPQEEIVEVVLEEEPEIEVAVPAVAVVEAVPEVQPMKSKKKKKKKIVIEKVDEYPDIEDTFIDKQYVEFCEVAGRIYNVSPEIMEAMIEKESRGNASAVNSSGCKGLCQVSERWHKKRMKKLGVTDLLDPYSNILVATDYLAELCDDTGDMYMALAYYGGWVNKNGTLKKNADSYISSLMKRAEDLEKKHGKEFGKTVDK